MTSGFVSIELYRVSIRKLEKAANEVAERLTETIDGEQTVSRETLRAWRDKLEGK